MLKTNDQMEVRALNADELDTVSGGSVRKIYGGTTADGTWVTCGTVVIIGGKVVIGGINGPVVLR